MVQVFCVVNCCFCQTFQGQQVKKEKKWTCKMCGEKQSFRKVFAQGNGKECHLHVQKLNMMKGNLNKIRDEHSGQKEEFNIESEHHVGKRCNAVRQTTDSKWKQFITMESEFQDSKPDSEDKEEDFFTTERKMLRRYRAQKRKKENNQSALQDWYEHPRKIQKYNTSSKTTVTSSHSSNQLQENHLETILKENRIDHNLLQNSTSTSPIKTSECSLAKPSKWSKFT